MSDERKQFLKCEVIRLSIAGKKTAEIAEELKMSGRTVRKYIKRYREMGEEGLADRRRYNGPQRKTSEEQDVAIVQEIVNNPFESAASVSNKLHLPVCANTVRRRLREAGFHCHRLTRKVLLSQTQREDRTAFALQQLTVPQSEWDVTIFTDEKTFSSTDSTAAHVWRPDEVSRYDSKHVVPCRDNGHVTCAMWGWISVHGPGELVEVSPCMNSSEYIDVLEDVLIPSVRAIYPEDEMSVIRLVQGNSAVHTSPLVQEWFADHPDITVVQWPAMSPDLNLIDNVWAHMFNSWGSADIATTRDCLVNQATCAWEDLRNEPEFFTHLYESVQNRFHQVIDRNGQWTDF